MPGPHCDDCIKPTARDGRFKRTLLALRHQTFAVALAARHPRTPWYAKAIALATVAYFLSPIDLIPDPIPFLGQIDDLLIVPLGVWLVIRLTPPDVMAECRERATTIISRAKRAAILITAFILAIWLGLLAACIWGLWEAFR
jgi:uncharacterized membrane protein YkvA (DUF1232 family)